MNQAGEWARYKRVESRLRRDSAETKSQAGSREIGMKKGLVKTQCIMEYLLFLTAVVFFMIIATIGMTEGMRANLTASTQEGISDAQTTIMQELSQIVDPPPDVMQQGYYQPPQINYYVDVQTDTYGGPQPGYEE